MYFFNCFSDSLSSYGFRGEALNALCQIGEVSVTTKTNSDPVASMYKFSHTGEVTSTQPSHFPNGIDFFSIRCFNTCVLFAPNGIDCLYDYFSVIALIW